MTDKIAIIICTANRYALLEKAVASLQQQSLPRNQYQIIVVDNSATTPEVEQAREKFASMTDILFHVEPVQGLSHARNVGMALAHDYPIIGYIDDDAMAAPTWAESAVLAFQHLPQVVGVGGPVAPLWEIPRPTWLADNLLCYLSVLEMGNQPRLFSVNQGIHGASMAFRADALKAAGGFPVNLGRKGHGAILLSNDETALVKTMRMKGGQFAYVPDMR
ncbi:MAG: glycosyltransferase family 2 protein, partial [Alphaproteobacteria bacterium]|nr:glycosyltransferase family 2 protein [Alphaproteobacteria bacterium]